MCAIERSNPKADVGQILKLYLEYFSSYKHLNAKLTKYESSTLNTLKIMHTFENLNIVLTRMPMLTDANANDWVTT